MSDGVLIALIICGTILLLDIIAIIGGNKKKW